ncbi:MAG: hypothetical protein MZU84_06425 [Sphingobacterium sp.]|nr:hypothetical protein [Sphingobacterium sp.]
MSRPSLLAAFAAAAVPAWSEDVTAAVPADPALRADRQVPSPAGPALAEYYLSAPRGIIAAVPALGRRPRPGLGGGRHRDGPARSCTRSKRKKTEWNPFFATGIPRRHPDDHGRRRRPGRRHRVPGRRLAGRVRYAGIRGIADPGLREAACAEALEGLARKGNACRTVPSRRLSAPWGSRPPCPHPGRTIRARTRPRRLAAGAGRPGLSVLVKSRAERAYRSTWIGKGAGRRARSHPGRRGRTAASGPGCRLDF